MNKLHGLAANLMLLKAEKVELLTELSNVTERIADAENALFECVAEDHTDTCALRKDCDCKSTDDPSKRVPL